MFVDVTLRVPLGRRLAVPAAAVIYDGDRRQVFVDRGHDLLEPRDVVLGPRAGDWFAVDSGLAAGDVVVTSGNFLVASESRLRSAAGGQ
jgi:Cu(I)/Ag(I) efflux system membrane fusion protein